MKRKHLLALVGVILVIMILVISFTGCTVQSGVRYQLSLWTTENQLCIKQVIFNNASVGFQQSNCQVKMTINGTEQSTSVPCSAYIPANSTSEDETCILLPSPVSSVSIEFTMQGVYDDGRTDTIVAKATL